MPPIKLGGEVEGLVSGAPAEVGNEQSLRVGCRFWSSSAILLEPLQMSRNSSEGCINCVRGSREDALPFPLLAVGAMAVLREEPKGVWGEEVKPVLERIGVVYLQPPL